MHDQVTPPVLKADGALEAAHDRKGDDEHNAPHDRPGKYPQSPTHHLPSLLPESCRIRSRSSALLDYLGRDKPTGRPTPEDESQSCSTKELPEGIQHASPDVVLQWRKRPIIVLVTLFVLPLTGGNAPRRELASKAKGAEQPTAKRAKTRPSPYCKPGQSLEPLAIPSLELQTIPSLELQPIPPLELQPKRSLRLAREVSRRTESRLSSPGPLYHHEVYLLLRVLRWVCNPATVRPMHKGYKLGHTPYRAFYGLDSNRKDLHSWVPALPTPITLSGEYSLGRRAHVSNTSTLILHFCLEGLQNPSLPPHLLNLSLQEYLTPPLLRLLEQRYDFTEGVDEHTANVKEWVRDVYSYDRVVVFITTHAHDITGDLYGGPEFSSDPYQVLNALFPRSLRKAFKDRTVYLNFLICGGFAETACSRMALFKAARRIYADEAIAFSSPGLIPSLTNAFWLDFVFRVLIEGASLQDALPIMLTATSTSQFVRHTNLLYVRIPDSNTEPLLCSEYVWTHPKLRPFGRRLPANCPQCGCINSYGSPIRLTPKAGSRYIFVCQGHTIEGNRCNHELSVQPMDGFKPFGNQQDGARWMVKTDNSVILELGHDLTSS
ncbi:hypothetical protein FIBSPDRAFT_889841 [Athelia psychrophila]|uniref:Uncharacterized protein n=1 Tax=Athelia psychrophila TaxID=1759441 RepID=A0A166LQR7_9AGAM|nr:hypothetical protein FIBSPDRAFT_889841 [Fibularhizoctonia sp. CBS 109695]